MTNEGETGMSAQDNIRIVQRFYDAANHHNYQQGAELLNPDFVQEMVPINQVIRGIPEFLEMCRIGNAAFPDMRIEVSNIIASDNAVVCEIHCIGTQTGPMKTPQGVIPPTNQKTDTRLVDIWEIRNGKITGVRTYFDSAPMQQIAGKKAA
jgi:steroid delta-isomerase-like uncharacterized protein